jgi:hypothetical protein
LKKAVKEVLQKLNNLRANFQRGKRREVKVELGEVEISSCGQSEFHDQGDAEWIVIRRLLWGHNDMPASGRPIGRPGYGRPQGVIGVFKLLLINNIIC